MKPLSSSDIQNLVLELKPLEGSRLQEVRLMGSILALGLYTKQLEWLVFDLNPTSPQVVLLKSLSSLRFKEDKKPIVLFLKAHLVGHRLLSVHAPPDFGRVLLFKLAGDLQQEIEVRLFPRGQNVIVRSGGKEVAYLKPQVLKSFEGMPVDLTDECGEKRSGLLLEEKSREWVVAREGGVSPQGSVLTGTIEKDRARKEMKLLKAVEKIEKDVEEKKKALWSEAGEWLKMNQTLEVPEEFRPFVDSAATLAVNLENCFAQAKQTKKKMRGALARRDELLRELEQVRSGVGGLPEKHKRPALLQKVEARGRTFDLGEGLVLYVGKSAVDNLRLLRGARPWYYWLHLRDEPSAHGVLHRHKNQNISDVVLHSLAHHLIATTYGDKVDKWEGVKFDVLATECRFVRPIKGETKGRVLYTNERSFTHLFHKSKK